jgi:hypothetical protein
MISLELGTDNKKADRNARALEISLYDMGFMRENDEDQTETRGL